LKLVVFMGSKAEGEAAVALEHSDDDEVDKDYVDWRPSEITSGCPSLWKARTSAC
jgi:hypothetical protein